MIIDCISDLHGFYPKLDGGDLLIIAGDLTARDEIEQYMEFNEWLSAQDYKIKIVIAGNHDRYCEIGIPVETLPGETTTCVPVLADKAVYLKDSGTEFEGLKIWGSPWTKTFEGMNPHCKAFTCDTEEELADKWAMIPEDTDILITHSPPYGVLDLAKKNDNLLSKTEKDPYPNGKYLHVGSTSLDKKIGKMKNCPQIHVWGHIHEAYGQEKVTVKEKSYYMINASHVNERYQPVNKPIRVIL